MEAMRICEWIVAIVSVAAIAFHCISMHVITLAQILAQWQNLTSHNL
jgi:hypothetical protein